ncbi:MAG: M48 family metalloprotease [Planctomycetes bacterium]|nr:M48 family metalloprotease [Planctomycetota bacterium]
MDNPFLQDLSAALVLSFGHFLWIGTLVATITAVAAHRQRTSAGRYQAWLAGFAAMAMTPVVTLLVLRSISSPAPDVVSPDKQPRPGIATVANADPVAAMDPVNEQKTDAPLEPATSVLEPATPVAAPPETSRSAGPRSDASWWRVYAPLVTDLYLIGVSLMGLRLLLGLWGGRRLQRRAIPVTDATLLQSLQRQATTIGMKYVPILAYCERVAVPTVLGILKPTILLPISVMSGLTADQIESVLAHELAHLRRHDHLVNLIQRVVESLLFFHPAIWWVSRCIREEREHCCDDLVIACGAVPLDYAQSLLRVAELSRATESRRGHQRRSFSAVSLLATGDRPSTLRQRVGRMLGYQTDMNVRAVHPWTLFCLSLFSVGAVWVLTSMTWVALAEIHRDHSQTTVIVGWSAIIDESVLREIRELKGTATEYSATAQGIQCSADELRMILRRHLDNKRLVVPQRVINPMQPSGGWGRHSELIQMLGSGSVPIDNRIGSAVEANWHADGRVTRIDVPDGVKVRVDAKYFCGLTGHNPIEAPVEFESELMDGQAAIVVLGPSQVTADSVRDEPQGRKLATVQVSLAAIFVYEAVRIPHEQVELLKSLTDTDGWIRRDSMETRVHVRRILDWRQQTGTDVFAKNPAWTHAMPQGGQIQLVGLSRPKSAPLIWWTPEGRPLTGVGDRAGQFNGDFCALVRISEVGKSRGIRQHPGSVTSDGVLNVEPQLMGGGDSQFVVVPVNVDPETDAATIDIGAGFGPWDAETTIGPETGSSARLNGIRIENVNAGTWAAQGRIPARTNTLFQRNRTPDVEITATAQTFSGGLLEADSPPLVITKRRGEIEFLGSPAVSHSIPKNEIKQFVLKSRPVHWTTFTGFSAEPVGLNPPLILAKRQIPGEATSPPANPEPTFVATLSNGISVKLVGVGFHPSGSREWWQPDGSNLEVRPYEKLAAHVMSDDSERGDCREFALQFSGLPQDVTVSTRFGRPVSMATTSSFKAGKGSRNIAAGPFAQDKTTSLIVGLASGPFGPVQQIGVDGKKLSAEIPKELTLFYDQIRPLRVDSLDGTLELVFQSLGDVRDKADWQLVAIDTDGNQVQSSSSGGTEKEFHFGFKLTVNRLARFEYRLRPWQQVTFDNVALHRGESTKVQISTAEIERPSAPKSYEAKLPGGVTAKLVGIGFHPSATRDWWQPDGTPLAKSPFEKLGLPAFKDAVKIEDWREFALQFQGLPPDAEIKSQFGRSVEEVGVEDSQNGEMVKKIAAGPFLEDKTADLILGIAAGPFCPRQQIDAAGKKSTSSEIPNELKFLDDQIQPIRVRSVAGSIALDLQLLRPLRDRVAWKFYAIDTHGNEVGSNESSSDETQSSFGFKLPIERLDHFEYHLRPIRKVRFENISLVPGEKSDVKVIAEQPASTIQIAGKILAVDSVKKLVEISLGQADGVKVRDRFNVYDEKMVKDPQGRPKGQIEVIRITPDGAVARILHEPLNDPVTKSDNVMFDGPSPATATETDDNGATKVDTAKMSTVELAQRAIRQMERRRLTVGRHTPAQVMQGLKAFGLSYQVKNAADPNDLSPAWDWISRGTMPPNLNRLWVIRDGIAQGMPYTRPFESEGHPGQFVAWLGAAGVSLDAQVTAIDENGKEVRITVQRLVDDLRKLRLELQRIGGQRVLFETDWQLWALAYYSAPATIWDMTQPKGQGIVELIERQLNEPDVARPYDGAVGRLGLAIARAKFSQLDPKSKTAASALLARVEERLDQAITSARSKSADGWIYRVDLPQEHREIVRLQFTGCELAWLSQALSSEELVRESWINNAARRVALELLESQKAFNVQEMTDAVLGLRMYLAKVAPGSVVLNGGQEHNDSSPSSKAANVLQTTPKTQDRRVPSKVDTETVVGKVVSPDGKPVPGIEVLVFQGGIQLDDKFTTDDRGEFRVPKAWRDVDHWQTAVARDGHERLGWFDFMVHGHSDKGQKTEDGSFRLVLLPLNRTVRGRVVDESGMPIARIPVQISQLDQDVNLTAVHWRHQKLGNEPLLRGAITDADGRFELKLPAESSGWLSTNHPDWVDARIRAADDQVDLGETRLIRAAKVTGRVIDSRTGTPLSGVTVGAFPKQTDFLQSSGDEATTDANGMYVISGLRPVEHVIQLVKGFGPILTSPAYATAELKSGESFLADFALTVGRRVTGRVLDMTTGEPIPKCRVACTGPSCPAVRLETETNERGEFELRVSPGTSNLDCRENRIFGSESTRAVTVSADSDPDPVVLKVGPATPAAPGQKIRIFLGRPVDRKVTVNFQQKTLADALEAICSEAGLKLELDEDGLTSVGVSKETPVTLMESKPVPLQRALTQILAPQEKLSFLVGKFRVYVSGREQVDARQRLLDSGDLPPEVPEF